MHFCHVSGSHLYIRICLSIMSMRRSQTRHEAVWILGKVINICIIRQVLIPQDTSVLAKAIQLQQELAAKHACFAAISYCNCMAIPLTSPMREPVSKQPRVF